MNAHARSFAPQLSDEDRRIRRKRSLLTAWALVAMVVVVAVGGALSVTAKLEDIRALATAAGVGVEKP
jgi:hypothetical protein